MHQVRTRKLLALIPALLLCVAGCSSSDPSDEMDDFGSFSVTLSGSASASFSGDATAYASSVFTIALGNGTTQAIPLRFGSASRPAIGSYDVVDDGSGATEWSAAVYITPTEQFEGITGTVEIMSSSETEISGNVNFTAEARNPRTTATINVVGSFRSVMTSN